jgi:hypothetical protein
MKILIHYFKTGKIIQIDVAGVNVGSGGIYWWNVGSFGFIGFRKDWDVTILSK